MASHKKILAWAQKSAHQDPITRKVMARLGYHFLHYLWREKKTNQAVLLGFATLGKSPPNQKAQEINWWPVPPQVWGTAQSGLIGDPITLEALMNALVGQQK